MPLLLAEVIDKVEESFAIALRLASGAALVGAIVGRWAPRPLPALVLAAVAAFAALARRVRVCVRAHHQDSRYKGRSESHRPAIPPLPR